MRGRVKYIVLLLVFWLIPVQSAVASEFSVKTERSVKQYSDNTYFDLLVEPDFQETLYVTVTNKRSEPLPIKIQVDSARTTSDLQVDYGNKSLLQTTDTTLVYDLKDLLRPEKDNYLIGAGETLQIPLMLKMPKEAFAGVIAGGIVISEETEKNVESSSGLAIGSQLSYEVAVVIRENEEISVSEEIVFKDFEQEVETVSVVLQNKTANFVNRIALTARIVNQENKQVVYEEVLEERQMAPNSNVLYEVELPQALAAGSYQFTVGLTDHKDNHWDFSETFVLSAKKAAALASEESPASYQWLYFLIGALGLLLLLVILLLIYNQRKTQKQLQAVQLQLKKKGRSKKAKKDR